MAQRCIPNSKSAAVLADRFPHREHHTALPVPVKKPRLGGHNSRFIDVIRVIESHILARPILHQRIPIIDRRSAIIQKIARLHRHYWALHQRDALPLKLSHHLHRGIGRMIVGNINLGNSTLAQNRSQSLGNKILCIEGRNAYGYRAAAIASWRHSILRVNHFKWLSARSSFCSPIELNALLPGETGAPLGRERRLLRRASGLRCFS